MPDINKHEIEIIDLKNQNIQDFEKDKIQAKQIEKLQNELSNLKSRQQISIKKFENDYKKLRRIILDENVSVTLDNKINTNKVEVTNKISEINDQLNNKINTNKTEVNNNINSINEQLDNIMSKSCSQIGLVANNEEEATNNYNKLISELNKGTIVNIDNSYYISGNETIVENFNINGNGKLIVLDNVTQIKISNSLNIKDVTINLKSGVNRSSNTPLFLGIGNLDIVKFENVTSENYIFMFRLNNESENTIKINTLEVINCKFENPQLLFHLYKVDCGQINTKSNLIHNNETVPFNFNNVNCKYVNIDGNRVINDINFWNNIKSTYFCMMILTGEGTCHYSNNEVNGLKTKQDGMAVYDAYLSYTNVYWNNNVWQDNVSVSANNTFNVLFYGKSADVSNNEGKRTVMSNTYKITKELLNSLSVAEKNNVDLAIYRFQFPVESFVFKNNIIDVGELKIRGNLGDQYFNNLIFENNSVKGHFVNDMFRPMGNIENSYISISENKFISTGETPITFLFNTGNPNVANINNKIMLNNNYFDICFNNFIVGVSIKELELNGNVIINTNESIWEGALTKNSIIKNISGINNVIKGKYAVSDVGSSTSYEKINLEVNKIVNSLVGKTSIFQLPSIGQGFIKIEETKLNSNTIFELPFILDGENITYTKSGNQVTETFTANKIPYANNNYLVYNYSTKSLNYTFNANEEYNLKIKYMIN